MRGIVTQVLRRAAGKARAGFRLAGALALFATLLPAANWMRLSSSNFVVYTDAGESTGRRAVTKLEQINQAFAGLGSGGLNSPLPVRVYLFSSRTEYARYRPSERTSGFFRGGPDEDYIVMHSMGRDLWRVAFHEYVHVVLSHTSVRLPQWLEEGTAEFYSTLALDDARLVIGRPIQGHLATLQRERWLTAEEFVAVGRGIDMWEDDDRLGIFYAQSWAMAHMLQMSPLYRPRADRYAALLSDGLPYEEAFARAFDRSFGEGVDDLRHYARRGDWKTRSFDWIPLDSIEIEVDELSDEEAATAHLRLQLTLGLWDLSEEQLEKLANRKGTSAKIEHARAMVAMSRDDDEAAAGHFRSSIGQGSEDPSTFFEYAMLLRERAGDRDEILELLRKAVELNPYFAEAHFILAVEASRDGRHADAIPPLLEAVRILPRQSYFWHALASAYYWTDQAGEAQKAARKALESARSRDEMEMAEAVMQMAEQPRPKRVERDVPEVTTPESWEAPRGNARVAGTLNRIDCVEQSAVLVIQSGESSLRLLIRDPSGVTLRGLEAVSFEFACGVARSTPIVVEYTTEEGGEHETAGEVTVLEFVPPGQ